MGLPRPTSVSWFWPASKGELDSSPVVDGVTTPFPAGNRIASTAFDRSPTVEGAGRHPSGDPVRVSLEVRPSQRPLHSSGLRLRLETRYALHLGVAALSGPPITDRRGNPILSPVHLNTFDRLSATVEH